MRDRPHSVTLALIFILVIAIIWLAFGFIITFNVHPAIPDSQPIRIILATLSFAAGGVLIILCVFLTKQNRVAFFFTLGVLIILSIINIFDDIGLIDLVFIAFNIVPILLLIYGRGWYLRPGSITMFGKRTEQ
jgi:hypothetical protein